MYTKNYLSEVILRIDFVEQKKEFNIEYFKILKDKLKEQYPDIELETRSIKTLEFNITDKESNTTDIKTVGYLGIIKFNQNMDKIELDSNHFSLSTSNYTKFIEFAKPFEYGLKTIQLSHEIPNIKRVGLRFVNKFIDEGIKEISDWSEYIHSSFLPKYGITKQPFVESNYTLRRNLNDFFFSDGDLTLHLKLGIWNPEFPSIITENELIVDIDCYSSIISTESIVLKKIYDMDHAAYKLFDNIITDKMKEFLGKTKSNEISEK